MLSKWISSSLCGYSLSLYFLELPAHAKSVKKQLEQDRDRLRSSAKRRGKGGKAAAGGQQPASPAPVVAGLASAVSLVAPLAVGLLSFVFCARSSSRSDLYVVSCSCFAPAFSCLIDFVWFFISCCVVAAPSPLRRRMSEKARDSCLRPVLATAAGLSVSRSVCAVCLFARVLARCILSPAWLARRYAISFFERHGITPNPY